MIPEVARPSRRTVVGAAAAGAAVAAGLLAGCSGSPLPARQPGPSPTPSPTPSPGAVQRAAAARDSAGLLARYDATAAAHPGLAARLAPLRAEVARHVQAFGGRVPAPGAVAGRTPSGQAPSGQAPSGQQAVSPAAGDTTAPPAPPSPASGSAPDPTATAAPGTAAASSTAAASGTASAPATAPPGVPAAPAAALAALATAERELADRGTAALLTVPGDLARLMASVAAAAAGHVVLLSPGPADGTAR